MHRPKSHLTSTIYAYIDASGRFIFCIFKSYSGFYCAQPYDLSIPINSRLIMTVPLWFGDMDSPQFATLQLYRTYCNCGEGLSRDTVSKNITKDTCKCKVMQIDMFNKANYCDASMDFRIWRFLLGQKSLNKFCALFFIYWQTNFRNFICLYWTKMWWTNLWIFNGEFCLKISNSSYKRYQHIFSKYSKFRAKQFNLFLPIMKEVWIQSFKLTSFISELYLPLENSVVPT